MWNRITEIFKSSLIYVGILCVIYLFISTWTFSFRHPWATDMERFIHIGDALMFKKISYSEMRGGYEK